MKDGREGLQQMLGARAVLEAHVSGDLNHGYALIAHLPI